MNRLMADNLRCVGDYRAQLGETPIWCERSASLLWVDILAGKLLRHWPQAQRTEIHEMPEFTSAVLLTTLQDVFIAVSQSGIWRYDYLSLTKTLLSPWPEAEKGKRPNEAAIAPDGSLWFSTMDPKAIETSGAWYRLDAAGGEAKKMLGAQQVPNTLQWHDDYVWFADSLRHQIHCARETTDALIIEQSWTVPGIPDGSALTTDGLLINARWGSSLLTVAALKKTTMTPLYDLPLPVCQPSSCTLGGPEFSDLFITSARDGLLSPGSIDGALISIKTPYTGRPANRFRL